jgi:hypothetical protein
MNFSHYLKQVENEPFKKLIFAQGNKPAALLKNGQTKLLSELILYKEDLESILSEIQSFSDQNNSDFIFYLDGHRYKYELLKLQDTISIGVDLLESSVSPWNNFLIPGYINDWLMSESGILLFYGSDKKLVEKVRLSFVEQRIKKTKGSSLVFSSSHAVDMSSKEDHFLTLSTDEKGFLNCEDSFEFDSYFFKGDLPSVDFKKVLSFSDRKSFVSLNSFWSQLTSVWSELESSLKDKHFKHLFAESLVGFIGVTEAESQSGEGHIAFEVLPFTNLKNIFKFEFEEQTQKINDVLKKEGVSFNQSLQSLVLKRKVTMESAYHVSPDPEELNSFLGEAGV